MTGVLANDSDIDGNPLTAVLVAGATNGTLTLNANGSFTYTANGDFGGADSFTYQLLDGGAPPLQSNTATVAITINAVNDPPELLGGPILAALQATASTADPARFRAFVTRIERGQRAVIRFGLEYFDAGASAPLRLATLSFSRMTVALIVALSESREVRVACAEGRPMLEGQRMAAALAGAGIDVRLHVAAGPPAETIGVHAADANADLIMMGRSRRFMDLGSTAVGVLRKTDRALLIVPPEASAQTTDLEPSVYTRAA